MSTLKIDVAYSSETSLPFNGVHGVTSQKIISFIITAVKASNPTAAELLLILSEKSVIGCCNRLEAKHYFRNIHLSCLVNGVLA